MTQITINLLRQKSRGDLFVVRVSEENSSTQHYVFVPHEYFKHITQEVLTVEEFIRKSFEFLLSREPKEAILAEFDISTIQQHFPGFEKVIKTA